MDDPQEAGTRSPVLTLPELSALMPGIDHAKEARPPDVSYIERNPARQVVLSPRLEQAARRLGGCQTEELLRLLQQVMYEVLESRKH